MATRPRPADSPPADAAVIEFARALARAHVAREIALRQAQGERGFSPGLE